MQLIETKTLASAAASIQFTSIPQDGTDLLVLMSIRSSISAVQDDIGLKINTSAANGSNRFLQGTGSAASSGSNSYIMNTLEPAASATTNTFGNTSLYIPNYAGSTNKSLSVDNVMENNATTSYIRLQAALWSNTAAITSLEIYSLNSVNLVAGSTISLYKITKGNDGITTVA